MERTEIGAEDFGRAQHVVEIRADDVVAAGPLAQPAVAPEDRVVAVEQHDAVGHALQDALVLHEPADVDDFGEVVGVGVDADEVAAAELGQGSDRRGDFDDFERRRRSRSRSATCSSCVPPRQRIFGMASSPGPTAEACFSWVDADSYTVSLSRRLRSVPGRGGRFPCPSQS